MRLPGAHRQVFFQSLLRNGIAAGHRSCLFLHSSTSSMVQNPEFLVWVPWNCLWHRALQAEALWGRVRGRATCKEVRKAQLGLQWPLGRALVGLYRDFQSWNDLSKLSKIEARGTGLFMPITNKNGPLLEVGVTLSGMVPCASGQWLKRDTTVYYQLLTSPAGNRDISPEVGTWAKQPSIHCTHFPGSRRATCMWQGCDQEDLAEIRATSKFSLKGIISDLCKKEKLTWVLFRSILFEVSLKNSWKHILTNDPGYWVYTFKYAS